MAHPCIPHIHGVTPDDIEVLVIPDQQLVLTTLGDLPGAIASNLHIAGNSDRERLANLIEIGNRIRRAALDLEAALAAGEINGSATSNGKPTPLPIAAPLTGQTVLAVTS